MAHALYCGMQPFNRFRTEADIEPRSQNWLYEGVPTASVCQSGGVEHHLREASVSEVIIIDLDVDVIAI